MPDQQRGTDRAGRRSKRFLSPTQKYEVFLQLVRQEMTMAEAAEHWRVDRGTVMRIRTVAKEMAVKLMRCRGKKSLGLSGRLPDRVEEATKAGLLDLLDAATDAGWSWRGACRELELGELRAYRSADRRELGELADPCPGGNPAHSLLDDEVEAIVALYHEWGEVDRSHRKFAPSTVRRVLAAQSLFLHGREADV